MFTNRFSARTVTIAIIVIALAALLTISSYAQAMPRRSVAINSDTYYPLPPGKQAALVNAARRACLSPGHKVQPMNQFINADTYYPLPPGKQAAFDSAALKACIDFHLREGTGQ